MIQNKFYTEYSFQKGMIQTKNIKNEPLVLITDHTNIHNYISNTNNLKHTLLACEIKIKDHYKNLKIQGNLTVIANTNKGYHRLCKLINKAWKRSINNKTPYIKLIDINNSQTLTILSGGYRGIYTQIIHNTKICKSLTHILKQQTNFYIELQRFNNLAFKESIKLIKLAQDSCTQLCATAPVRYLTKHNFKTFRYKHCIQKKHYFKNSKKYTNKYKNNYLISNEHKLKLFKDCIHLIQPISKIINKTSIKLKKIFKTKTKYHTHYKTLKTKIKNIANTHTYLNKASYKHRLHKELKTIKTTGFAYYFLITSKIVKWAKTNKIQVGPGRGSCASSLIAYLLKITDIDPIKHDLIFERFLNEKKTSIPDFDIDFCKKQRHKVVNFIKHTHTNTILNIITFSKFLEKNTIRDICRILGYSFNFSSKILNHTQPLNKKAKTIINITKSLTGKIKAIGTHAGGLVISNNNIPISILKTNTLQTLSQFDKYSIEQLKLVKLDILGLKTLTNIDHIKTATNIQLNFRNINIHNKHVFNTIQQGNTTGIFQLESKGITNFIKRYKVNNFKNLVNAIAIYRPGPLNTFSNKQNQTLNSIKEIKTILKDTKGEIIFQEQIIKIVQTIANYTLNESDYFRKQLTHNKCIETEKLNFIKNCKTINPIKAEQIFEEIKKVSGYSFNKAHAVSYAYITYTMAWLKTYKKLQFFVGLINNNNNTIKLAAIIKNIQENKIKITQPNINTIQAETIISNNKITLGLKTIKGLSLKAIKTILKTRQNKPFTDTFDFVSRLKAHIVNKQLLKTLYYSGLLFKLETNNTTCLNKILFAIKHRKSLIKYKQQQLRFKNPLIKSYKRNILKELFKHKEITGKYNTHLYNSVSNKIRKLLRLKYLPSIKAHNILIGTVILKLNIKNYKIILETNTNTHTIKVNQTQFKKIKLNKQLICGLHLNCLKQFISLNESTHSNTNKINTI